jgi:hypothetical protein
MPGRALRLRKLTARDSGRPRGPDRGRADRLSTPRRRLGLLEGVGTLG